MIPPSLRIPDAVSPGGLYSENVTNVTQIQRTQLNLFPTRRSHASQMSNLRILFTLHATPSEFCHQFRNLPWTKHSTGSCLATHQRPQAQKMVSLSHPLPSPPASVSHSLSASHHCTPQCWPRRCKRRAPTAGSSTLAGPEASSELASDAHSSTLERSSMPFTTEAWQRQNTQTSPSSTCKSQSLYQMFQMRFWIPSRLGLQRKLARVSSKVWLVCSQRLSTSTRQTAAKLSSRLVPNCRDKITSSNENLEFGLVL